jgi:hypothetical protein
VGITGSENVTGTISQVGQMTLSSTDSDGSRGVLAVTVDPSGRSLTGTLKITDPAGSAITLNVNATKR